MEQNSALDTPKLVASNVAKPHPPHRLGIIAAAGLLICFFLPWIQIKSPSKFVSSYYAFNFVKEDTTNAYYYTIPLLAALAIVNFWRQKENSIVPILAAIVPWISLSRSLIFRGPVFLEHIGIGFYGALIFSLVLLICCVAPGAQGWMTKWFAEKEVVVLDGWMACVANFHFPPPEFYDKVEKALNEKEVSGLSCVRITYKEGGALSKDRLYLRLMRERMIFDICAAPFGTEYFFNYRLSQIPLRINWLGVFLLLVINAVVYHFLMRQIGLFWSTITLLALILSLIMSLRNVVAMGLKDVDAAIIRAPLIGPIYEKLVRKETYYREDTREMYKFLVRRIVEEQADKVTAAKGIKLTEKYERKPILEEIYRPIPSRLRAYDATGNGETKPAPASLFPNRA